MSKSWQTISNNRIKCPPSATLGSLHVNCGLSLPEGDILVNRYKTLTREGPLGEQFKDTVNEKNFYLPPNRYFKVVHYPVGMVVNASYQGVPSSVPLTQTASPNPATEITYPNDLVNDIFPLGYGTVDATHNPYDVTYDVPGIFPTNPNSYLAAICYVSTGLDYLPGDSIVISVYVESFVLNPSNFPPLRAGARVIYYDKNSGYLAFAFQVYPAGDGPQPSILTNYIVGIFALKANVLCQITLGQPSEAVSNSALLLSDNQWKGINIFDKYLGAGPIPYPPSLTNVFETLGNSLMTGNLTVDGNLTVNENTTFGAAVNNYTDLNGVLNLNSGTVQGDPDVDNLNKNNTYIRFGEAGTTDDWAYLRQIGGPDSMNISLDMFDNANDGRFTIRGIQSSGATPNIITNVLNVSRNNIGLGANAGQINQGNKTVAIGVDAGSNGQKDNAVAVGPNAGQIDQGNFAVAVGSDAGNNSQNPYAVSIGFEAGKNAQGPGSVAIGYEAGGTSQGNVSVAIGYEAGKSKQGDYAIAIGTEAGKINQANNSIILNASNDELNSSNGGLYIKPIRNITGGSNLLHYNSVNGEITYESGGAGAYLPLTGGTLTGNLNLKSTLQLNDSYGTSGQILTSNSNISAPTWNDIAYRYVINPSPATYSRSIPSSPTNFLYKLASIYLDVVIPNWNTLPESGIGYIHCVGGQITLKINGGSGADLVNLFLRMVTSEGLEFDSSCFSFSQRSQSMTFMAPSCFSTINFSEKPIEIVIYCDKQTDDPIEIDWQFLKFEIIYYPLNVTRYPASGSIPATFTFP